MKLILSFLFFVQFQFLFSKQNEGLEFLLNKISKIDDSKKILTNPNSVEIIEGGVVVLMDLSEIFVDNTQTNIYSICQERNLTKGEVAIILSDHILNMPYFHLTEIQNCTLDFCQNNPNNIEFYLQAIERKGISKFKDKYQIWLKKTESYKKLEKSKNNL